MVGANRRRHARRIGVKAIAYFRTSSATNVGEDKDMLKRQRAAVEAWQGSDVILRLIEIEARGGVELRYDVKRPEFELVAWLPPSPRQCALAAPVLRTRREGCPRAWRRAQAVFSSSG